MEFNIFTNLFIFYIVYISRTYIKLLFNKKARTEHITKQKELERMRCIPNKTPLQQKQFLDLKYPKKPPIKWSFKFIIKKVIVIIIMITVYIFLRYLWKLYICINIKWWLALLIMFAIPLILNTILKKYNLHQDDVRIYFR